MAPLPQATSVPVSCPDIKTPDARTAGQPFIPHKVFPTGIFLPDVLLANSKLSLGAKLLWARLARYAGADGACFPAVATLAVDLGCSERQVQRYVAELIRARFLAARQRGFNRSNLYQFLWHSDLESPPRKLPNSTTDVSSCPSATDLSSSSTTQASSLRADLKSSAKEQATHVREPGPGPKSPACPSPGKPKSQTSSTPTLRDSGATPALPGGPCDRWESRRQHRPGGPKDRRAGTATIRSPARGGQAVGAPPQGPQLPAEG